MSNCERCGRANPTQYGLWDYCGQCSKGLCDTCMEKGCCGNVPAQSGMDYEYPEDKEGGQK